AYLPLDPAYPVERLAFMVRDSGARLVVTSEAFRARLPEGAEAVCLDAAMEGAGIDTAPAVALAPESLAYVIYTSGSTGTPKGVMVSHGALAHLVAWHVRAFGVVPGDRATQVASPSFDAAVWETWPYLAHGAALHPLPEEDRLAPESLQAFLLDRRITLCFVPTPLAEGLLALPWPRETALRALLTGGDALRVRPRAGLPFALVNNYGPTEGTVVSTSGEVSIGGAAVPSIGRPIDRVRARVLDAHGSPVPVGVPGELYVGGDGAARGYLGRPELTAERFVPDPFSPEPGARLYRTGDRVRWRRDGELEFLGRMDAQVKIRGFRIEPGEIEAVLLEQPGVREAVVAVREDTPGQKRLVAYVVPQEGADLPTAQLRARLAARLPEFMVPGAFVALERLPLNANGKADRLSLPAPERAAAEEDYLAARTPTEEMLCGIWAEVLGVEMVGAEDDFFELGGHSLLATQVVSRARQAFGTEVPLRALFEAPTVAGLARRIDALRSAGTPVAPPIERAPREGPLPASFAQQRLWYVNQLEPDSPAYNMPHALRLRGRLDAGALRASLNELVRRHETLRTVFAEHDGAPVQLVRDPAPAALAELDLRRLPEAEREAEAVRLAEAEALRPFDLSRGPLLRSTLLRLADDDHVLLFTMHHVVSDGWSRGVLVREVSALYAAFSRGEEPRLPELPVQYADYAAWQREWFSAGVLAEQVGYWKDQLGGAPPLLEIPTDRPRSAGQSARGGTHRFTVPTAVSRGLRALSAREGTTLFMTLLAAWQALLGRYAGQADVVVGTPIAGRTQRETEGLIGFFVNMLALRADLSGDPTWTELLGRVRETALGAYDHQELPFERLVEELATERSLAHAPVFQVVFALNRAGARDDQLRLGEVEMEPFGGDAEVAKFDLDLAIGDVGEELGGTLVYREALFEAGTVARMVGHLQVLLESMVADPGRRLTEVSLLSRSERARVLESWNATAADYPPASLHELVSAQAARTPDRVAVVCSGEALIYADLEARADRLARHLRCLGVGPETRVGVCAERSAELVVALLAVLKAGGAYVPLDPSYPAERLAYMLEDSGVPVLLAQERLRERLPAHDAQVVCLDRNAGRIMAGSAEPLPPPADPDALAYVIYTSGSTGRPKGAMNAHRGIVNRLLWMQAEYALTPHDVVLQKTPFSFDVSVWEFFWPLITGARLVLAKPEGHRDPAYLAGLIEREGVTTLHFVPPMLAAFLEAGEPGRCGSLRRVMCSGEALPYELTERFREALPGAELHNLYGPTETAVDVTYWACEPRERRVVPIGRPVANTRVFVLDGAGEPAPVGVPGELYLGGVQVGRGYLGRPELTAERFVPDPFGGTGGRLYRTGDRARWTSAGELEYLGRIDQQVKIRGFRIEPGEVEAALLEHGAVREAVVLVREDVPGEKRLVGYVVPMGGEVSPAELRAHLQARLPEYMVPSALGVLESVPLTPSGKVDRGALPAPEAAGVQDTFLAPRDVVELQLARVWEELLGVRPVGVRDDFFALGGHSFLALRLLAAVERLAGRRIPLATLLAGPTVERLAGAVREEAALPAAGPLVLMQPAGSEPPLFFVHAAGGSVVSYAALARHLGSRQPFYGLQSRGLEGEEHPHLRVEDMAEDYLAQLRAVQKKGPYRLGGWSMGGLVAFEMARMLEAAGEEVELLALLDSRAPRDASSSFDPDDPGLLAAFMLHLGVSEERIARAAEQIAPLPPAERLRSAWEAARAAAVVTEDLELARFERLWTVFRANVRAVAAYRPGPCASDLLLVLAEDRAVPATAESAGWEALTAGTVRSVTVPGDHFNLVQEPHVRELATVLAGALSSTPPRHDQRR
ncbi:MAG TPA: amino acid adenylation domain-containing protein, partial [Longimicrobiaceae bacterium]|nr:amino acid adenylation domain-containing protein [Longimicrobiaceae bacterium]